MALFIYIYIYSYIIYGFFRWLSGKDPTCSAGDAALIPGLGRSPGGGYGNPLQYSCLGKSMSRGIWQSAVHGVAESDTTEVTEQQHSTEEGSFHLHTS